MRRKLHIFELFGILVLVLVLVIASLIFVPLREGKEINLSTGRVNSYVQIGPRVIDRQPLPQPFYKYLPAEVSLPPGNLAVLEYNQLTFQPWPPALVKQRHSGPEYAYARDHALQAIADVMDGHSKTSPALKILEKPLAALPDRYKQKIMAGTLEQWRKPSIIFFPDQNFSFVWLVSTDMETMRPKSTQEIMQAIDSSAELIAKY